MYKKPISLIIVGLLLLLFTPFAVYFLSPVNANGQVQNFTVEKGNGVKEIGQSLTNAGLVKSPAAFFIYSILSRSAHQLKAGNYQLSPAMGMPEIVSMLKKGPVEDKTLVVKEGERLNEIENDLVAHGVIKKNQLSKFPGKSLEGFLVPDTYRFFPNSSVNDVVKKFLANFSLKAMPTLSNANGDFYKTLIVASIIEKEVPFPADRALIAGILYKRLAISMPLQVDSSPWTYDHYGLPPKPISNPGLDAIRAAVYPKSSDFLYYLSDPVTKKTIFSKTFEEHKENRWKYLRK